MHNYEKIGTRSTIQKAQFFCFFLLTAGYKGLIMKLQKGYVLIKRILKRNSFLKTQYGTGSTT